MGIQHPSTTPAGHSEPTPPPEHDTQANDAHPHESSSQGNLDLAVLTRQRIVLFEFNTVPGRQGAGRALRQLKA